MAKRAPVHCRICKKKIDRDLEQNWVMPSKNFYYHEKCFNDWGKKMGDVHLNLEEDEWFMMLKDYIAHDLKYPADWAKITSQWKHFLSQKKTAKGIYFAVKYFYDYANGKKEKAQGGIGIVSSIYEDSCRYWQSREAEEEGILQKIEQQMREKMNQRTITVERKKIQKKDNRAALLSEISLEDDE